MMKKRYKKNIVAAALAMLLLCGCGSSDGIICFNKAEEHLKNGQYSQALEQYKKAIMEDEELLNAYRGAGIASLKMADYKNAKDFFLRSLGETDGIISEDELDTAYYLGETYMCLLEYKKAEEQYSAILQYDSGETDAYFYRGCVKLKQNKMDKAKKDFEQAAKSKDMAVLYGIYEAYAALGMEDRQAYLDKIVALKADSAGDLYIKGKAYMQLGKEKEAVESLKKSIKKGDLDAIFYLGTLYERKGEYETALNYYKQYQEKKSLTFGEYKSIADCMVLAGDLEGAVSLNESMQKKAGRQETQDLLFEQILLYEKACNYEEARNKAQSYVEKYPKDEEGLHEYEFLMSR